MIVECKAEHIQDIAQAHIEAWKQAFKGILSERLLANLSAEEFEENWRVILTQKGRRNFVWLDEDGAGVAFIAFGKPKDEHEAADIEIYGMYVHPDYWGRGVGYKLMQFAMEGATKQE